MTAKRDRKRDQQPNTTCIPTTWRPEAAFVLAAGMGSRMRHLTATVPKPMVPLKGIPLIDRVLGRIADAGIATAIVNVHY
ncbi:MAG: NTP transferase domain-containing protein, partial [Hyphomicrobiaceae bacterium]|nr:NTP transferase domain-containing protein [Hyphomicrobiaceae bacterium]